MRCGIGQSILVQFVLCNPGAWRGMMGSVNKISKVVRSFPICQYFLMEFQRGIEAIAALIKHPRTWELGLESVCCCWLSSVISRYKSLRKTRVLRADDVGVTCSDPVPCSYFDGGILAAPNLQRSRAKP